METKKDPKVKDPKGDDGFTIPEPDPLDWGELNEGLSPEEFNTNTASETES